jgi:excisionase family DNA binding protein
LWQIIDGDWKRWEYSGWPSVTDHTPKGARMSEIKSLLLKPCLRIDEAAILLDVTPRTIHRYLDEGKLTPVLDPAGRKRVRTDDVKRYL